MSKGSWKRTNVLAEPDAIDCNVMLNEIGNKFGLAVRTEVRLEFDFKTIIARAGTFKSMEEFEIKYQALYKVPIRSNKPLESMMYHVLWDIYQQADMGTTAVQPRPIYEERLLRSRRRK